MSTYFSFLVCDHGEYVNMYYNGLPLGKIVSGHFQFHEFDTPSGNKRPLTINDLPHPCPFKSMDELAFKVSRYALMLDQRLPGTT